MGRSEFTKAQRRQMMAASPAVKRWLLDKYRRDIADATPQYATSPQDKAEKKRLRRVRQDQLKGKRLAELGRRRAEPGTYGPGTGRGALPSKQKLKQAQQSPSLLEQLRRDGKKK